MTTQVISGVNKMIRLQSNTPFLFMRLHTVNSRFNIRTDDKQTGRRNTVA